MRRPGKIAHYANKNNMMITKISVPSKLNE